jgi:phosphoglycerate kinase
VSDKVLIIENLLNIASDIIIGGGMAYTFAKAQGGEIGNSLFEADRIDVVLDIFKKAKELGVSIHLPSDSVVADSFAEDARTQTVDTHHIPEGWMGLDIGPASIQQFQEVILKSKTILWNGPMGVFEWNSFARGTKEIALSVATATEHGAFSLIGGGDSAAAIAKFGLANRVSYISTGGGALLELFEGKTLPGINALD